MQDHDLDSSFRGEVIKFFIAFHNLGWSKKQSFAEIQNLALEIAKMLNSLIKSMK